ncbi:MAG: carboxypeptidase regulatory-like domain-containing protein [Candidatus Bathyarchaeia archaeon]
MKLMKKPRETLLFLSTILIMLVIFNSSSAKAGGLVYGRVLGFDMHESLKPISWAKVEALRGGSLIEVAYSSENGHYEMYLPNGDYILKASSEGYETKSMNVTVSEGSSSYIEFKLEPTNTPIPEFSNFFYALILSLGVAFLLSKKRI